MNFDVTKLLKFLFGFLPPRFKVPVAIACIVVVLVVVVVAFWPDFASPIDSLLQKGCREAIKEMPDYATCEEIVKNKVNPHFAAAQISCRVVCKSHTKLRDPQQLLTHICSEATVACRAGGKR